MTSFLYFCFFFIDLAILLLRTRNTNYFLSAKGKMNNKEDNSSFLCSLRNSWPKMEMKKWVWKFIELNCNFTRIFFVELKFRFMQSTTNMINMDFKCVTIHTYLAHIKYQFYLKLTYINSNILITNYYNTMQSWENRRRTKENSCDKVKTTTKEMKMKMINKIVTKFMHIFRSEFWLQTNKRYRNHLKNILNLQIKNRFFSRFPTLQKRLIFFFIFISSNG